MAISYRDEKHFRDFMDDEISVNLPSLESVIEWIAKNMVASEVFSADHLKDWAEDNGYAREED